MEPMAVLGAGSWGTALALVMARNGFSTRLWGRNATQMDLMAKTHASPHLPQVTLPASLEFSADLSQVLKNVSQLLVAVPSAGFRSVLEKAKPLLPDNVKIAWATKGFCEGKLLHEVVHDVVGDCATAIISGPSFAKEVAAGFPTAITIASQHPAFQETLTRRLHDETLRVYSTTDLIAVQVGGAVKNVLAIAVGIASGLGYGANACSALVTRGLAEMVRLGVAMGGKQETFMGLAGLGDLVLTCGDNQSRNRRFGVALGKGIAIEKAIADIGEVVEGFGTAKEVYGLAQSHHVEMPITQQVYGVLYENVSPKTAVNNLLSRQLTQET